MRILFLTTHLHIGGVAVYTTSLARALAKRGHRVTVISSGGNMVKGLKKEGVLHIELDIATKSELSPKLWRAFRTLAVLLKKEKPDVIHGQTRITQVLAAAVSRRFRIPYVSTCHGFFKRRLSRRLFGCWGHRTIAISEAVRRHLMRDFGVDEDRIELIHNGVDISRFGQEPSNDDIKKARESLGLDAVPVVGTIGRLSPVKGIGDLISAFGDSPYLVRKARLMIVGDGPEKERFEEDARRLNIKDRVLFIESNLDTPRFLSCMDVFVFPSVQEGLGLSLIEAMAAGRPVVATDVGGVSSLVKDNETGLLTKKGDKKDLARAINRLLDDEGLRARLASNGRDLVRREYTLEKMAEKTEQVYRYVSGLGDK